jgi:hypothetical protein
MGKLTDTAIRGELAPGKYGDGEGLWLLVSPKGAKRWAFRWKFDGWENSMTLGPYPTVTLAKARIEAGRRRAEIAEGKDPSRLREQERQKARLEAARAVTFEQAAKEFIASREDAWKNPKHRQNWPDCMEAYVYPLIGKVIPAGAAGVFAAVGDAGKSMMALRLAYIVGCYPDVGAFNAAIQDAPTPKFFGQPALEGRQMNPSLKARSLSMAKPAQTSCARSANTGWGFSAWSPIHGPYRLCCHDR